MDDDWYKGSVTEYNPLTTQHRVCIAMINFPVQYLHLLTSSEIWYLWNNHHVSEIFIFYKHLENYAVSRVVFACVKSWILMLFVTTIKSLASITFYSCILYITQTLSCSRCCNHDQYWFFFWNNFLHHTFLCSTCLNKLNSSAGRIWGRWDWAFNSLERKDKISLILWRSGTFTFEMWCSKPREERAQLQWIASFGS